MLCQLSHRNPIRALSSLLISYPSIISEVAQTVFGNSITLTPGTITVEAEDDFFWVHAVGYDESDHAALAEMDARVTATEAA